MRQIIILTLAALGFVMCDTGFGMKDTPIPEEIVIVKAPIKQHPYQTEYEQMLYPTVRITAGWSTGTGVIIATTDDPRLARDNSLITTTGLTASKHRYTQIITAAHVVSDETTVDIELYDSTIITGTVVITDTVKDLALIRVIRVKDIYSAHLAPEDYKPYIFTPVWAVGCSLGLEPRPSFGHITSIDRGSSLAVPSGSLGLTNYWEISAPILPGNSGGPVYDARTYEVIGIAVWVKVCQGQLVTTMAGIVPINQIYEFLNHR